MKYLLLVLLLSLPCFAATAQISPRWMLAKTPTQVKANMLGEPGNSIEEDKQKDEYWRLITIKNNGGTAGYNFFFYKDLCLHYRVLLAGIHTDDINSRYSDLKNLGQNDWVDDTGSLNVYIHRQYNGNYTELLISTNAPD